MRADLDERWRLKWKERRRPMRSTIPQTPVVIDVLFSPIHLKTRFIDRKPRNYHH